MSTKQAYPKEEVATNQTSPGFLRHRRSETEKEPDLLGFLSCQDWIAEKDRAQMRSMRGQVLGSE